MHPLRVGALVLVSGCVDVESTTRSAIVDGPSSGPCSQLLPFEPSYFTRCDLGPIHPAIHLERDVSYYLSTDTGMLVRPRYWDHETFSYVEEQVWSLGGNVVAQPNGPEILVIASTSLHVDFAAGLGVFGSRALAWVATGDILVEGGVHTSAANDRASCASGLDGTVQTDAAGRRTGSGGGGAGGTGDGGAGGAAFGGASTPGAAANASTFLTGGCPGGAGGGVLTPNLGRGGSGGGAIQLVAGRELRIVEERTEDNISVGGWIEADGGGGLGGGSHTYQGIAGGGGGGGSGGTVVLEALDLALSGWVTATGGGGGGGGGTLYAGWFGAGGDVYREQPQGGRSGTSRTLGAAAPTDGDGGGAGWRGTRDGTDGRSSGAVGNEGGGGGGGAAGTIRLRSTRSSTIASGAWTSPTPE